jgi:hypothetical protein
MEIFRQLTRRTVPNASPIQLARGDASPWTDADSKFWIRLLVALACAVLILRCLFECLCFHQESISFPEECISLALEYSGAVT